MSEDWYRDRVVWMFLENGYPEIYQGKEGEHELCKPVNAEMVRRWIQIQDVLENLLIGIDNGWDVSDMVVDARKILKNEEG